MEMFTNAVLWAEIPVSDFDRAKAFYSAIYEFEMPEMQMGENRMGFFLYEQGNGVGAAIVQGNDYEPCTKGSKIYLNGGSDLNTVLNRVEGAGGTIVLAKTEIAPGMGFYATFLDTEGNAVSLHSMQ